jgi:hypothetical protein
MSAPDPIQYSGEVTDKHNHNASKKSQPLAFHLQQDISAIPKTAHFSQCAAMLQLQLGQAEVFATIPMISEASSPQLD